MDGLSPAYKLLGRTIRNNIPYQKINQSGIVSNKNRMKLQKSEERYREYSPLNTGDVVRIRGKVDWKDSGVIVGKSKYPRSYIVEKGRLNSITVIVSHCDTIQG